MKNSRFGIVMGCICSCVAPRLDAAPPLRQSAGQEEQSVLSNSAPPGGADPLVFSPTVGTKAGGIPIPPTRPVWQNRPSSIRSLRVPEDFSTIRQAVAAAQPGDLVAIGPGDFHEAVVIDKAISLVGSGPQKTRLHGLEKLKHGDSPLVIRRGADVAIAELTVRDSDRGIFVDPASRLEIRQCHVIDNVRDGVYMEQGPGDVHTCMIMEGCLVARNGDGVDYMGGQGFVVDSTFQDNTDDGVDVDGDTGVLIFGCTFTGNRDDGIEVRLRQRTYVFAVENSFDRNGEDGVEIIDTYLPEHGVYNVISVQNNRFDSDRRFAVGFVDQKTEKLGSQPVSAAVFAGRNTFAQAGEAAVSENYRGIFEAANQAPGKVQVTLTTDGSSRVSEHQLSIPLLVGVYDFKAMTDGTNCQDTEDVAVSSTRIYVPDDDAKTIYVLDRHTGDLLRKISMAPIAGSTVSAKGPEGVHVVEGPAGDEQLWVVDDDGLAIYQLSLAEDNYGRLLKMQSTAALGACEGIAVVGGEFFLTRSKGLEHVSIDGLAALRPFVEIHSNVFGGHVAGVGVDRAEQRVFVSTNGYHSHDDWRKSFRGRDLPSGTYELNRELTSVRNVWNLGPFCDDARGVAFRDGLLYAVCGRQPYTDTRTGELVRNGEKVFVFAVDARGDLAVGQNSRAIKAALPHLPLRCGR